MATVDLIKVGIRYMGDWDSSVTYEALDFVRYEDGRGYVSLVANSNVTPGTDGETWALSVNNGLSADGMLLTSKIIYSSSDTSVSDLAWGAIHVFPAPSSLSFTLASAPSDSAEHQMTLILKTPSDLTDFTLTADPDIYWGEYPLTDYIAPSKTYVISIDSKSMLATYISVPSMAPVINKINYGDSSVTSYSGLSWDSIHMFPEMPSLSFTMGDSPDVMYNHKAAIIFSTPLDISDFTLTLPQNLTWEDTDVTQSLSASSRYTIIIDCDDMKATWSEGYNSLASISDIALPLNAEYRVLPITTATELLYSSSNTSVATVDANGVVTGVANGTATITMTDGRVSAETVIHVGSEILDTSAIPAQDRVVDEMEIINPISSLQLGDEYALYAVGISNNLEQLSTPKSKYDIHYYNPVKFSSSDPSVAVVMFGTLMAKGLGTCTITATDKNNNASDSFTLTVVAKEEAPTVTQAETYVPSIDNTGATDVAVAIYDAFAYAAANNYKKISFPQGTYLVNGDNRPGNTAIRVPGNMIIDFNGSVIRLQECTASTSSVGNMLFMVEDTENVWFRNLTVYAENYQRATNIVKDKDRSFIINGLCKNIHVENCEFSYSPGFNFGIWYKHSNRASFYSYDFEAGGLDDNGGNTNEPCAWRTGFKSMSLNHGFWSLGNFDGYQTAYLGARLYDIFFYDIDKNLVYKKRNCYVFQRYDFPAGVTPKYYRFVAFRDTAPEARLKSDGVTYDYFIGQISDILNPRDIYIENCTFRNSICAGLTGGAGSHVILNNCYFENNGRPDAGGTSSVCQIDWEDGRQNMQGHIVKNCTFKRDPSNLGGSGGSVTNGYGRNITIHDCYFYISQLKTGSESVMNRIFHNTLNSNAISLSSKCDSIFAGNTHTNNPSVTCELDGPHFISVDNQMVT